MRPATVILIQPFNLPPPLLRFPDSFVPLSLFPSWFEATRRSRIDRGKTTKKNVKKYWKNCRARNKRMRGLRSRPRVRLGDGNVYPRFSSWRDITSPLSVFSPSLCLSLTVRNSEPFYPLRPLDRSDAANSTPFCFSVALDTDMHSAHFLILF